MTQRDTHQVLNFPTPTSFRGAAPTSMPQRTRSLRGRRLVVVDIENISGGAIRTLDQTRWVRRTIESAIDHRPGDQVVIGCGRSGAMNTTPAWPGARLVIGRGLDGADLALLAVLEEEDVVSRFDDVVLASGDGIFTGPVDFLGRHGVTVTVVSHSAGLSKRLRMAASRTIALDSTLVALGGAA